MFSTFVLLCIDKPCFLLLLLPGCFMMLLNGLTDAPVAVASAVNSGAVSLKKAATLAAVFNFLGAVAVCLLGSGVAKSVIEITGVSGLEPEVASKMLISAMLAVAIWSLSAYVFGIPTSESHALLAALSGGTFAVSGRLNIGGWGIVLLGLLISTLPVIVLSKFVAKQGNKLQEKQKIKSKSIKKAQTMSACISCFAHGVQDSQKFAALISVQVAVACGKDLKNVETPLFLSLFSAAMISLGMLLGGKRIIGSISKVSNSTPVCGISADITSAFILLLLSALKIPTSTTSAKTTAVMGAGGSLKTAFKNSGRMLFVWILTLPSCAIIAYFLTMLLL